MPTSTGTIIYDPYRGKMKKKTEWWCVVEIDNEIVRYLRWWINKEIINPFGMQGGNIHSQSWSAHISVIRGEKPLEHKAYLWKKYHRQLVEFDYDSISNYKIVTIKKGAAAGVVFIVEVRCPFLINIRKEFGFKSDWPLHLTFARTYQDSK